MEKQKIDLLKQLFQRTFNETVEEVEILPPSGSYREYCRLKNNSRSVLGVFNADSKENNAFFTMSDHFLEKGIRVPNIYAREDDRFIYLCEDFGDVTLFQYLTSVRNSEGFSRKLVEVYKKVVKALPSIQIKGSEGYDYSNCYPREAFDKQSMMWDLSYFKYYFLKLARVSFDEQALENDFHTLTKYLLSVPSDFFLYRDFQSRNIMIKDDEICFIDYQGGRKGALHYDIASLLFDAKADIPHGIRLELLQNYLNAVEEHFSVDRKQFRNEFFGFVMIRIMQAMGAYGFRGFYEKKQHFLKSIPYALENMRLVLDNFVAPEPMPELMKVLKSLPESPVLNEIAKKPEPLTVRVTSFSYKRGVPEDPSGNGGGFAFDCRAIHNPGRYDEYKQLSGLDESVQVFLREHSEIEAFLFPVFKLVEQSVEKYMERGFQHLCVNFGCTGGQHRSVYSAERLTKHLKERYNVRVVTIHREMDYWKK